MPIEFRMYFINPVHFYTSSNLFLPYLSPAGDIAKKYGLTYDMPVNRF